MLTDEFNRVLTITPQEVIEFFEQSADLCEIAPDVRDLLGKRQKGQIPASPSKLQTDLERVFEAGLDANASKADIAEALTGDRAWGGEAMKKRLNNIQNLLTMAKKAAQAQSEVKEAA